MKNQEILFERCSTIMENSDENKDENNDENSDENNDENSDENLLKLKYLLEKRCRF